MPASQSQTLTGALSAIAVRLGGLARSRWAPRAATVVLAAALLAQATSLVLASAVRPPSAIPPLEPATASPGRAVDVDLILASHLFREAAQNADAAPLETTAELLLSGVVAFPAPSDGYAILGPSPDQARLHRAGGELSAGLRLLEVFADHVVLEHDGMREILRLPTSRKAADPADPALAAAPAPAPPSVSEPGGFVGGVIRAQPVFAGRRVRGYRVYEGQYGNSLQSLGLNPGDLVIEINGERLGDPGQAKVLLDRLARDPEIGVVVRRGSEERALHLDIATAVASARADADFIRAQQAAEVPDPIMRGRDRLLPPTVSDSP